MKKLKHYIPVIILAALFFLTLAAPVRALNLEDAFSGSDSPLHKAAGEAGYREVGEADVVAEQLIGDFIRIILSFIGVVFLILMIYGGYMWMLARGNEQQVTKAKELILAAIIGLLIIVSSFAISYFVMEKFGSATLDQTPEQLGGS